MEKFRWVVASTAITVSAAMFPVLASAQAGASLNDAELLSNTMSRYCVTCHNDRLRTADFSLDGLNLEQVGAHGETWEKVIAKLRTRTMPPPGRPRPDIATYDTLAGWLESQIATYAMDHPEPGRTEAFHRLNRAEYANAVRDLISLDVDVAELLPADNIDQHGFDNMADVLTVSPALMERYLSAARKISRLAVGEEPLAPATENYSVYILKLQDDRMSDDLPFGSRGGIGIRHYFPVDGEYDPDWEEYMLFADSNMRVRFPATAGPHVVSVAFVRRFTEPEGVLQPRQSIFAVAVNEMRDGNAAVDRVAIGGPYVSSGPGDTPSRQALFTCQPVSDTTADEEVCARDILSSLARRAYRRPVESADLATLMDFYQMGRDDATFDSGIQLALERVLISPDFLFRVERDPVDIEPATVYAISDLEIASRLSYFVWSTGPDDELLDLAESGALNDPVVLEQQAKRMLRDPRATALVKNFAGQWLYLRNLRGVVPDGIVFPEFDENLREAFQSETELFVESLIREDRSVLDLLGADYTFVNERLARHYGIPNVYGPHFRRIPLDAELAERRGGIFGHGSLLTVTSYPNRTSPVLRGKWVLSNVLGTPPPPPPADVPDLPDRGEDGQAATVRDRLATHRESPACSVCHAPMDPLGLALENYDAVGKWRLTGEADLPIDSSGNLPDGTVFEGPSGLRTLLLERKEQFIGTLTEKLLAYAIGRGPQYYDRATVRDIVRSAETDNYRWSAVIVGIVKSAPFRMRRSES